MKDSYVINKPEDFQVVITDILNQYSRQTDQPLVIALQGNLGAGKTTFTQQLAEQLGVIEVVNSPTFTIMKQYDLADKPFERLVHIDAYRFESEDEAVPLRLEELITNPKNLVCIEWPEQIISLIPDSAVWLKIESKDNEVRIVTVKTGGE